MILSREGIREDVWDAFRACDLWRDASDGAVAALARASQLAEYARGSLVFYEGDDGVRFAVLVSGHLRGLHINAEGRRLTTHMVWPGDAIGGILAAGEGRYAMDVEAAEPSTVALVPAFALKTMFLAEPQSMLSFLSSYAKRVNELVEIIKTLNADVTCRVARHLLRQLDTSGARLAGTTTIDLRMTRIDLAANLGTVPETLSRAFAHLREAGLIETNGHQFVTVVDESGLAALAAGC